LTGNARSAARSVRLPARHASRLHALHGGLIHVTVGASACSEHLPTDQAARPVARQGEAGVAPGATLSIRDMSQKGLTLDAHGRWTAAHAANIDAEITDLVAQIPASETVTIDMSDVAQLDTFGAWLLDRLVRESRSRGAFVTVRGLVPRFTGLVDVVRTLPAQELVPPQRTGLASIRTAIARSLGDFARDLLVMLGLFGAVCACLAAAARKPATFRLTSLVHQLDRVAWQAVPIVLLITFLIGGIIAQQGFFHFRKFGADQYVVDMVGILVLREIGVLLVAIMVAGRSGSSYTAELGSMKMREEIDALRTMGLDPIAVLILPRVASLVLALPALALLGSLSALYGGGLVAWLYGDMSPAIFLDRLREAVSITHVKVGLIKAPFMALVIGIVACSEGLKVKGSAESLGLQTTASVVKSIFLVIVLDGLFAIYFSAIGM
jgi:phospholipid/cholesterol/gamma-HCH transport system permease protein